MGEGLMLSRYYLWNYVACIIVLLAIPIHAYFHLKNGVAHSSAFQALYLILLLIGNIIVVLASVRYWGWLRDEILKDR